MSGSAYEQAVAAKSVDVLAKLLKHPKLAGQVKRAIKEIEPNANFPELDAEDQFVEPVRKEVEGVRVEMKGLQDRLDKMIQDRDDRDAEGALASDFSAVQKKYGFTEDGLRKVMERMRDKNNPDVESAASFVNERIPRAKPAGATGTSHLPESFNLKTMFGGSEDAGDKAAAVSKDPWAFFDAEVRDILNEDAA